MAPGVSTCHGPVRQHGVLGARPSWARAHGSPAVTGAPPSRAAQPPRAPPSREPRPHGRGYAAILRCFRHGNDRGRPRWRYYCRSRWRLTVLFGFEFTASGRRTGDSPGSTRTGGISSIDACPALRAERGLYCCVPVACRDHIHLYLSLPPDRSIASLVNALKANSCRWIHATFPRRRLFAWQTGYAAFSVSKRSEQRLMSYILNQEAHHRREELQREMERFLDRHGLRPGASPGVLAASPRA